MKTVMDINEKLEDKKSRDKEKLIQEILEEEYRYMEEYKNADEHIKDFDLNKMYSYIYHQGIKDESAMIVIARIMNQLKAKYFIESLNKN